MAHSRQLCALVLAGTLMSNVADSATRPGRWEAPGPAAYGSADSRSAAQSETDASMTTSDGVLAVQISYVALLGLRLATKVYMAPVDAGTQTSFATSFTITTPDGLLEGSLALDYLSLVYGVVGVTLQCSNGASIPLDAQQTCPGSTVQERQKRTLSFIALPIGGLYLTPNSNSIPYMTAIMTPGGSSVGARSTDQSGDKTSSSGHYVSNMGMQW